jgi:hypothetical protein
VRKNPYLSKVQAGVIFLDSHLERDWRKALNGLEMATKDLAIESKLREKGFQIDFFKALSTKERVALGFDIPPAKREGPEGGKRPHTDEEYDLLTQAWESVVSL